MTDIESMLNELEKVERLATTTKVGRILHNPLRYIYAIALKNYIYPSSKLSHRKTTKMFTGREMTILLPAATDIYLTGGKSHNSEIRLARFLIRNLKPGHCFLDIGAHDGYFSLLAGDLTGPDGKVFALEPARDSFSILKENSRAQKHINPIQKVVSDKTGKISFYEFPNLFSEYNSVDARQYRNEKWFEDFKPTEITIDTTSITDLTIEYRVVPNMIKIDVEGAELKVIEGGLPFFHNHNPIIAMEYQGNKKGNHQYKTAIALLADLGYKMFIIGMDGKTIPVSDIDYHLNKNKLDSDNIILKK